MALATGLGRPEPRAPCGLRGCGDLTPMTGMSTHRSVILPVRVGWGADSAGDSSTRREAAGKATAAGLLGFGGATTDSAAIARAAVAGAAADEALVASARTGGRGTLSSFRTSKTDVEELSSFPFSPLRGFFARPFVGYAGTEKVID